MAINAIILKMQADGLSATQEHPGGTWSHTPEYFKYRYGQRQPSKARVNSGGTSRNTRVYLAMLEAGRKMTKAERIQLTAMLSDHEHEEVDREKDSPNFHQEGR